MSKHHLVLSHKGKMNLGVPLIILLVAIYSCKAVRIEFGELDYVANEGDTMARLVLIVSESSSQYITIPLILKSFDEYFNVDNNTLSSIFDSVDLPDEAEYSIDDNGRRDFVRNGTIEITFPPSNNIQEKEVLISLVDDQINEAEEGFLVLVDADNIFIPEEVVDLIRDGVTVVKIVDNDPISVMFERNEYSVSEQDGYLPDTIIVTKGGIETEQDLEILVQQSQVSINGANKGTDFDVDDAAILIFLPSDNTLPVPVTIIDDNIPEEIEPFSLYLIIAETSAKFSLSNPNRTTVNIVDNDAIVIGFEQSSYTITEGETATVCIQIKEPETSDVVLATTIQSKDGTATLENGNYEQVTGFVFLPTSNGIRMSCIEVVTNDNDDINPSRNFVIDLNFTIDTPPNALIDIHLTNIVIQDNDVVKDPCASSNCAVDAVCVSTGTDTFQCICQKGFIGDGRTCEDACSENFHNCHAKADCIRSNTTEGYQCICRSGYVGNGQSCEDVCTAGQNDCHQFANCTKTLGGYICTCRNGFTGDGRQCTDIKECLSSDHKCHDDATCVNTDGGYHCSCKSGFMGNGIICLPTPSPLTTPSPQVTTSPTASASTELPLCDVMPDTTKSRSTKSYSTRHHHHSHGHHHHNHHSTRGYHHSTRGHHHSHGGHHHNHHSTKGYHHSTRGRHHSHGGHHHSTRVHDHSTGVHDHLTRHSRHSHTHNSASSRSSSSRSDGSMNTVIPCVERSMQGSSRSTRTRSTGTKNTKSSRSTRTHHPRESTSHRRSRSHRRDRSHRRVRGHSKRRG